MCPATDCESVRKPLVSEAGEIKLIIRRSLVRVLPAPCQMIAGHVFEVYPKDTIKRRKLRRPRRTSSREEASCVMLAWDEGIARFQETLHSYSGVSHQPKA
jgi:hypothetical protein